MHGSVSKGYYLVTFIANSIIDTGSGLKTIDIYFEVENQALNMLKHIEKVD